MPFMSNQFMSKAPKNWQDLKQDLFGGAIFILPPSPASLAMVADVKEAFAAANGYDMHPLLHETHDEAAFSKSLHAARALITPPAVSVPHIAAITGEFSGAQDDDLICDVLRLRGVAHIADTAQSDAPAAPSHILAAHRDCWYANPQSQVNIWIPLFDVDPSRSFLFHPRYFNTPIANTSVAFDYDQWVKTVGFQSTNRHAISNYPVPTEAIHDDHSTAFAAASGARVIFSPSHLHQTIANTSGLSRFSVDFRVVSRHDIAQNRGAPNVDNASHGAAQKDYVPVRAPSTVNITAAAAKGARP